MKFRKARLAGLGLLLYRIDPVPWVRDVLGKEPAPWQEELLRAPRGVKRVKRLMLIRMVKF